MTKAYIISYLRAILIDVMNLKKQRETTMLNAQIHFSNVFNATRCTFEVLISLLYYRISSRMYKSRNLGPYLPFIFSIRHIRESSNMPIDFGHF